jgi:ubiquinone/menaquinone biosynthesis C-methylase UbiE
MFNNKITIQSYDKIANDYLERNRDRTILKEHIDRFMNHLKSNDVIIDVGCGPGFDAAIFHAKDYKVFALDRSTEMINRGRQEFQESFVQADMRHLPFFNKVNALWVNASIIHLQRKYVPETLSEFHQSLQEEGILFISVKEGKGEGWDSCSFGGDTPRWFTYWEEDQLDMLLHKANFMILESWCDITPKVNWLVRICQKQA